MNIIKKLSPNYTSAAYTKQAYGVPRTIEYVVIHHWDDPAKKPTITGTVNWLCNPNNKVSAHYVVEAGTVYRLVEEADTAWHAGSVANPRSIGIECNPRCSDGDYQTISDLIADICKRHGRKLPIYPHKKFSNTACPGNYNIDLINALVDQRLNPPPPPNTKEKILNQIEGCGIAFDPDWEGIPSPQEAERRFGKDWAQLITKHAKQVMPLLVSRDEARQELKTRTAELKTEIVAKESFANRLTTLQDEIKVEREENKRLMDDMTKTLNEQKDEIEKLKEKLEKATGGEAQFGVLRDFLLRVAKYIGEAIRRLLGGGKDG